MKPWRIIAALALLVCASSTVRAAAPVELPELPVNSRASEPTMSAQVNPADHTVTVNWAASTSAAGCVAPCSLGYNIYKGTVAGAESATPLNAAVLSVLMFTDTIVITSNPQTLFYYVKAVETSDGITIMSDPSIEVSATFPGKPLPPGALVVVKK